MTKELKEAKKKIEMLTNHLLDAIVDLLSDSQKIAYLKAIQPFVMPKLQDVKQQTSFDVSENLEWLIDSDEKDIERNIHRELGIGTYTGDKGLA
jgi:predicted transcriptional regulator